MLFGSNKLVGLDIGTSTIKLVEVEGNGKNMSLSSFGYVPTPTGSIVSGEIVNPDILSMAISDLIKQTRTKRKLAAVSVCGSAVITKRISIPRIEENLLAEQLKWEAEQYIPFDINEINLGYNLIRKGHVSPEQMSLLLVAAKREHVMKYAEVVEVAGLQCSLVDVSGFALANCYLASYGQQSLQSVGLLCMGASHTHFVIIENGEVTFCRDLAAGGISFTYDIQKALGVTVEEAEALKISAGNGQPVPQEVTDACAHTSETISEEIRRSYDFYLATAGDSNVQKFYATGGGFSFRGLRETVQTALGLPVEQLNPFLGIKYDHRTFTPEFINQIGPYVSIGLGLAMRGGG